ncbi:MAG: heme transporter [Myxococcales bacterium]|nr:heme transporter [Myxococcales bacterium]
MARGPRASVRGVPWARQAWLVFRKDVEVELHTGEVVLTSGFFALLVVVIASLAFYAGPESRSEVAPGVIWVSIAFASVLALGRTWQRERELEALSGLLVLPIARSAIFAGKACGVFVFTVAIEALVVPATALMFDLPLGELGPGLVLFCLAATPGIAAAGTLFAAMTVRTSARELVLTVVLFPLLAPTLLAAVAGTRELVGGAPLAELGDYFALMGVFAIVFVAGGLGLFGTLVES